MEGKVRLSKQCEECWFSGCFASYESSLFPHGLVTSINLRVTLLVEKWLN